MYYLIIWQFLLELSSWFVVSLAACILEAGAPNSTIAPPSQLPTLAPMAIDSRRAKDTRIVGLMHTVVGVHGRKLFQTKNRAERVIGSCFMRTHVCMYRLYLCLSRTEHYVCNVSDTNTAVYPNPKQFYRPTYPRRHIEHDVHPLTQQTVCQQSDIGPKPKSLHRAPNTIITTAHTSNVFVRPPSRTQFA